MQHVLVALQWEKSSSYVISLFGCPPAFYVRGPRPVWPPCTPLCICIMLWWILRYYSKFCGQYLRT